MPVLTALLVRKMSIAIALAMLMCSSFALLYRRFAVDRSIRFVSWAYMDSVMAIVGIDFKRRKSRAIRYILKCLLHPRASLDWVNAAYESMAGRLIAKYPQLLLKPHRHYINKNFSFSQRAELVLEHYAISHDRFSESVFSGLVYGKRFGLASLSGKPNTGNYLVTLERANELGREGELCMSLRSEATDQVVYRLAFLFGRYLDQSAIYIGCLLGPRDYEAKARIKSATRSLYGIRPVNLLMDVLYALASRLNIQTIQGVSSSARVCQGRAVKSDYDRFWKELGGIPGEAGFFLLPNAPNHRKACDVSSHHRAEFRRRFELRARLTSDVQQWISNCEIKKPELPF